MQQALQVKKLVSISTTFMLVTGGKKTPKVRILDQIACICYPG